MAYRQAAELLYSDDPAIAPLLSGRFPEVISDEWRTKHGAPLPNQPFADYVRQHDWARLGGPASDFSETQNAWRCVESRDQWPQKPVKYPEAYKKQKADHRAMEKDIIWDLRHKARMEAQGRREASEVREKKGRRKAKKARKAREKIKENGFGNLRDDWGRTWRSGWGGKWREALTYGDDN